MAIPATITDIKAIASNACLKDAEMLQFYKLIRDQIAFSIHQQEAITYLEIRNRRVQVSDPLKLLEFVELMIKRYSDTKSRRNVAKLVGPR